MEIDGHDFHERTKEQAIRDRSRDRLMIREGFVILRFTGSEVFYAVEKVSSEIEGFLVKSLKNIINEHLTSQSSGRPITRR